jgi:hypothetical protein
MIDSNIHQHVVARAMKDAVFRQELLSNPKTTLAREFNFKMADSITVRVLEDTPSAFTIVLPTPEVAMQELSDADLEQVAGAQMADTKCSIYITYCGACA